MECKNIDTLMMKYLDDALTEKESKILIAHIEVCEKCKADFMIYDEISTTLSTAPLYEAPEGFVLSVMTRLDDIPQISDRRVQVADTAVFIIFGVISVLLGSGLLLAYNSDRILEFMSGISYLSGYAEIVRPFSNVVNGFLASFRDVFSMFISQAGGFLYGYRFIIIAVCSVAMITWYFIRKKDKVETK